MKVIKLGATEARNNFFEILDQVKYGNQVVKVYKNNKLMAKVVSEDKKEMDLEGYKKKLNQLKAKMPIFDIKDEKMVGKVREKSKKDRFPKW